MSHTTTRIDEIADRLYRISTPVPPSVIPGGFTFNQYLVLDDAPLLFHTGMRSLFPQVADAIERVMPLTALRYVSFSHFEADECGSLNDFLVRAPEAVPVCGKIANMIAIGDFAMRPAKVLADGEGLDLGGRTVTWFDTPHLPHNWETGYLFDRKTETLLCGDIFTHGGDSCPPLTSSDLIAPTEAFRLAGVEAGDPDYCSHGALTQANFEKLARTNPRTLAVMHGSAWQGTGADGAAMLRDFARTLRPVAQ